MTMNRLWKGLLALVFAVAFCQFTPTLRAQDQSQDPAAQPRQEQQQPQQQEPSQQKARTFLGQIVKAQNGQYALLVDKQAGKGFYLDNQERAKKFEGQNVKVLGTLDIATNTIHVTDIEAS